MKAVIFDLDGTLADTRRLYAAAYQGAFEHVLGRMPAWDEFIAQGPSSERHFLLQWLGEDVGDRVHRHMLTVYEERAPELHGPLFDGVERLIERVRAAGLETAIVTGKSRAAYEVSARYISLAGYRAVVVEDDVELPKPDPAGIRRALDALGLSAADTVYVGDTPMDLDAARRAGARPAAALWSRRPDDRAAAAAELGDDAWALLEPGALLDQLGL